jgi:hypothetical protein
MTAAPDREAIDWSVGGLDEVRWRQLAEAANASELQLRFSVLRYGGASASKAAKIAGYKGDAAAIRTAGYSAVRSTAVQNLLELAAVNSPEDARISDREIDAKIAKLIRSADSNVALKATEIHAKRAAVRLEREAASGSTPTLAESARELLSDYGEMGVGLVALSAFASGINFQLPPFREIVPHIKRDWPDLWSKLLAGLEKTNPDSRVKLVELGDGPLADLGKFKPTAKHNGSAAADVGVADAAT